ncbi:hypothetical protein CTZ28_19780 [Streptomyces shenzhenensis]|uniref:Alpha/beta hydrolase n=1 Tax=Streptomyces shenzhenensis TaxID=943815 RepID=A0A3M0I7W4_9ACTN|nr:hypothetical protein CTZ28_19780 [Streptomyces shenzhenensis]
MVVGAAALAAAGWLSPVAEAVSTGQATTSKPTVVLVHGAFADAPGWNSVAEFPDPGAVTGLVGKAAASTAGR